VPVLVALAGAFPVEVMLKVGVVNPVPAVIAPELLISPATSSVYCGLPVKIPANLFCALIYNAELKPLPF
jgi:hypothetical protein